MIHKVFFLNKTEYFSQSWLKLWLFYYDRIDFQLSNPTGGATQNNKIAEENVSSRCGAFDPGFGDIVLIDSHTGNLCQNKGFSEGNFETLI